MNAFMGITLTLVYVLSLFASLLIAVVRFRVLQKLILRQRVRNIVLYRSLADKFLQPLVPTSRRLRPWQLLPPYPHLVHSRHTIHFRGPREIPSFLPFSPILKDKAHWEAHYE